MRKEQFSVNYISVKNCFLYFSENWLRRLNDLSALTSVLKVQYGTEKLAYFSWSPQPMNSKDNSIVSLSATYAHALGLQNEDRIAISLYHHVASINRIEVSPVTSDDWEILAMCSSELQSSLLDQIQVVWPGQHLVAWVSRSVHVALRVESLEPKYEVGRMGLLTDVVVAMPQERTGSANNITSDSVQNINTAVQKDESVISESVKDLKNNNNNITYSSLTMWDSLKSWLSLLIGNEKNACEIVDTSSKRSPDTPVKLHKQWLMYRVHPLQIPLLQREPDKTDTLLFQPYNVFLHRVNMFSVENASDIVLCKLTSVPFPQNNKSPSVVALSSENTEKSDVVNSKSISMTSAHVRVCVVENAFRDLTSENKMQVSEMESYSKHRCILVPDMVCRMLNVKAGSKVMLETMGPYASNESVAEIQITPVGTWEESADSLETLFRMYVVMHTKTSALLVNSGALFPLQLSPAHVQYVLVRLVPTALQYAFLDYECAKSCKITVNQSSKLDFPDVNKLSDGLLELDNLSFRWANGLVSEGLLSLEMSLGIQPATARIPPCWSGLSLVNILIVGKCGSGRSSLAKLLCSKVRKPPYFVHHVQVQCRHIKGKKVESLRKLLSASLVECVYYQPSVLILHDLEVLAGAALQEQDVSAEGTYLARAGEMVSLLLEEYQTANHIAVIATAPSVSALNTTLASARGRHTFKTVLQLPELAKVDRLNILENLITTTDMSVDNCVNLDTIAHKSEGFVVQDLVDLVDKAVFEAWKRIVSEQGAAAASLRSKDLERALESTTPLSLHGVQLYRDTERSWQDVGGLADVKEMLVELLLWPSQYPELFTQSPLRHQSGILLYGAPGTGKTLLAGALAHECGLNFISIKGPELLSKYIGASEESVRGVFQKAQSAKPCVLFFDEFDSLAPRRGHDSTGVTDRVVNQLLTQLDGVESLTGVWVVAATSRPDLLDPALLRPGRLDRAVQCPLPGLEDRLAILTALSRKLQLSEDVDLTEVAGNSDGFTGADLQAILYTAQLMAVEKMHSEPTAEEARATRAIPAVNQQLLLAALRDTRPSLTSQEKRKYDSIYRKFAQARGGARATEDFGALPQRATLA